MASKQKSSPALWAGLLLLLGLGYALFVRYTGWMLPCPIHLVTGLYCPGCGVSRMCLALLEGDWAGAWRANPALLLALAPMAALVVWRTLTKRRGADRPTRGQQLAVWCLVGYFLAFGVLRNLPGLACLRPG